MLELKLSTNILSNKIVVQCLRRKNGQDPGAVPGRSTRKNTVADFTSMSRILKSALEIGYSVLPNGPEIVSIDEQVFKGSTR